MSVSEFPDLADARREAILNASERVFAEKGYHDAGIADIAKELGIGHGTFYRYFRNKHDIALQILERGIQLLVDIAVAEDPGASNTLQEYREQTDRILSGWMDVAESHPDIVRIIHEQAPTIDLGVYQQMMDNYVSFTSLYLQNGVDKGFLRAELDIDLTAQMLVALIFEGNRRALLDPDPKNRDRWKQAGINLMFDGIRGA